MEKEPPSSPPDPPDWRPPLTVRVAVLLVFLVTLGVLLVTLLFQPPEWLKVAAGMPLEPVAQGPLVAEPKVVAVVPKFVEVWHKELRAGLELEVPVVLESVPAPLLEKMRRRELWRGRLEDGFEVEIDFVDAGRVANPLTSGAVLTMAQKMVNQYGAAVSEITQEEVKIAGVKAMRLQWGAAQEEPRNLLTGLVLQDEARTWMITVLAPNGRGAREGARVLSSVHFVPGAPP